MSLTPPTNANLDAGIALRTEVSDNVDVRGAEFLRKLKAAVRRKTVPIAGCLNGASAVMGRYTSERDSPS